MGNSTSQFVQIEVPIVNQFPDRRVSDHRRIKEICLEGPAVPLLKVNKVVAYRFETIAAGASDSDDDLWRVLALAHATYPTDQPGLAAALEWATQNYWHPRSRGPLAPVEDGGIIGCDQPSANELACDGQPLRPGYQAIPW